MGTDANFRYGVVAALGDLPRRYPVALRGDIAEVAATAKAFGYNGLELHIARPRQYDAALLRRVADDHGLEYCGIATGMEYNFHGLSLIADDAAVREAAVDRLTEHMELAAVIGGPVIVGIMRGNLPAENAERSLDYYRQSLLRLDERAGALGVPLVVEAITRYICNYLNTITETADFLSDLGTRHTTLHIDTHSMNIEDIDMPGNIRRCQGSIGYVHYSDSNRWYPGGGHIDFAPIHQALADVDYSGFITVECLPEPDGEAAARLGMEFIRSL